MFERAIGGAFSWVRDARKPSRGRAVRRPLLERLEDRQLLVASIGSIPNVTVPQSLGYLVAVDGTGSGAPSQSYSVTSDNPHIGVTVAQGPFVTFTVSHTPASGHPTDPTITNEPMTFQLFQNLTPNTAGRISNLTGPNPEASWIAAGYPTNYYNGKYIARIAGNFDGQPNGFVIQGGYQTPQGGDTGSGVPTIGIEPVQQLAYVQPYSIAMARTTDPNSNDAEWFITTGTPTSLNYQYTLFGQLVSGKSTVDKLTQVSTTTGTIPGEVSQPISPVVIDQGVSSPLNPNGVVQIDATGAVQGETATVRVTAFDPSTSTTAEQTFTVTIGADTTKHPANFTFKPLAFPVTKDVGFNTATSVQLAGTTQNPNNPAVTLQYGLASQPAHGTITDFDASKGTLTYTPNTGYTGPDVFTYNVTNLGGTPSPLAGNTQTVTLNVGAELPIDTGAVRVIGSVLVVTPSPRPVKSVNNILVSQEVNDASPANEHIKVSINGKYDATQPLASSISRIVVYGSKATDRIYLDNTLDPTIKATLNGGQGGQNSLRAGPGSTRSHGWYGQNTLIGGTGANQLLGQAGRVRFRPTATTQVMFAGVIADPTHRIVSGRYFRNANGKAVPGHTPAIYRHGIPSQ